MTCYTYILLCSDNSLYIGHAHDLNARLCRHKVGRGAVHTAVRGVERIVYYEGYPTEEAAVARERQIKKWSRPKKLALVRGNASALRELSRSRD